MITSPYIYGSKRCLTEQGQEVNKLHRRPRPKTKYQVRSEFSMNSKSKQDKKTKTKTKTKRLKKNIGAYRLTL